MKVSHPFHNLAALSGKMNEEKRMQLLQVEKNELDTQTQQLREQLNQKGDEVERLNSRVMELEHETSQSRILKAKVDELMSKNFQKDQTTKEKEENMFNLKREVESLRSDIRNMKHIESTLKAEIEDLLGKRKSLDEVNQNLKNQICEWNIAIRQMASQFDAVKRENLALSSNSEIYRRSEEQLISENNSMKELIKNIEMDRIHYRSISEQLQRELAYAKENAKSFTQKDMSMLGYNKPSQPTESYYQGSSLEGIASELSKRNNMTNYDFMIPQNDITKNLNQSFEAPKNQANFDNIYKAQQMGIPPSLGSSQSLGSLHQLGASQQPGASQQLGASQQFGTSQQFGASHQPGASQQFGTSQQFGAPQQQTPTKQPAQSQNNTSDVSNSEPQFRAGMKPQTETDQKSQKKLPQHMASSIIFDYPDKFDQYYRKNQDNSKMQAAGEQSQKQPNNSITNPQAMRDGYKP